MAAQRQHGACSGQGLTEGGAKGRPELRKVAVRRANVSRRLGRAACLVKMLRRPDGVQGLAVSKAKNKTCPVTSFFELFYFFDGTAAERVVGICGTRSNLFQFLALQ